MLNLTFKGFLIYIYLTQPYSFIPKIFLLLENYLILNQFLSFLFFFFSNFSGKQKFSSVAISIVLLFQTKWVRLPPWDHGITIFVLFVITKSYTIFNESLLFFLFFLNHQSEFISLSLGYMSALE